MEARLLKLGFKRLYEMLALRDTGGKSWKLTQEGEEVLLVQDLGLVVEAAEVELKSNEISEGKEEDKCFKDISKQYLAEGK